MNFNEPVSFMVLSPAYKNYLWGGEKIPNYFDRNVEVSPCAESWELSDRSEGPSLVSGGAHQGITLSELLQKGALRLNLQRFPLLIKLIDAKKPLSIQVHPNEEGALELKGEPKSEMWYVLDAEPNSKIYLGLKKNVSQQELKEAIAENRLEPLMHAIEVQKGDVYYIPAGLLHAIGQGCLIYEVQQNSNTTYRFYDWGRVDQNGAQRPLHIQEGLSAMNKNQIYQPTKAPLMIQEGPSCSYQELLTCPYFSFRSIEIRAQFLLEPFNTFRHYFLLEGELSISSDGQVGDICRGQSFIVGEETSPLVLNPKSTSAFLLETLPKYSS